MIQIVLADTDQSAPLMALGEGDVHVWLASLNHAGNPALTADPTSAQEREKAAGFFRRQHREQYLAARGLLRTLLGNYLGLDPAMIEFTVDAFGKPSLAGAAAGSGVRFSVSHSDGLALLGFARCREIGVDLEKIRPEFLNERIAENFFTPSETARLRSLPPAEQCAAFFECWTRKEAYLKARGEGLSRPLDSFEVAFGPGACPAILRADDEPDARSHWTVVDLKRGGRLCLSAGDRTTTRCSSSGRRPDHLSSQEMKRVESKAALLR